MKKIKSFLPKEIFIITVFLILLSTLLSGSSQAATIKEWNNDSIYIAGDRVSRDGIIYEAAWWTQGEDPAKQADEWGVWRLVNETTPKPEQRPETGKTDTPKETNTGKTTGSKDKQTGLSRHVITGYWQNFDNGAKCLKISDVPKEYNLIAVAFAEQCPIPGKVTFQLDETLCQRLGGYNKKQFIKDIKSARKKGQHVIISVGGENGTVSVTNAKEAKLFVNSIYKLMKEYGFDGVDIDLEHGINARYMAKALRMLSKKAGKSLVITIAPQTLDMQNKETEYFKLALKIKDILTIANTQYYNSGSMLGADGKVYSQGNADFLAALASIQLENGLRPDQIGIGVPASVKGAGSGYVPPSVVNKALNCLAKGKSTGSYKPKKKYKKLRGIMCWSVNWDADNGYKFLKKTAPVVASLP
ncbi:MAG: cellulose-binding protein [Lachnospiraceae bacterium]|nr:cellulose-binding protein [Lachnospiraceae bacterium]